MELQPHRRYKRLLQTAVEREMEFPKGVLKFARSELNMGHTNTSNPVGRPQTIPRPGQQIPHDAPHRHGAHPRQGIQKTRRPLRQGQRCLLPRFPRRPGQAPGTRGSLPKQAGRPDGVEADQLNKQMDPFPLTFMSCASLIRRTRFSIPRTYDSIIRPIPGR